MGEKRELFCNYAMSFNVVLKFRLTGLSRLKENLNDSVDEIQNALSLKTFLSYCLQRQLELEIKTNTVFSFLFFLRASCFIYVS